MDSKTVSRAIRSEIRPLLRDAGFSRFTDRTSWRFTESRIHVINFESFNSYHAEVMGVSTYSFCVNLGCFLPLIPNEYGVEIAKDGQSGPLPHDAQCHFRGRLERLLPQMEVRSAGVWYIDPQGRYLAPALHDVRMAILREGLPWFSRLDDTKEVLRILLEDEEQMGVLWGFGRKPSPLRHYYTGYVARCLGDHDLARKHLQTALDSARFARVAERLRADITGAD